MKRRALDEGKGEKEKKMLVPLLEPHTDPHFGSLVKTRDAAVPSVWQYHCDKCVDIVDIRQRPTIGLAGKEQSRGRYSLHLPSAHACPSFFPFCLLIQEVADAVSGERQILKNCGWSGEFYIRLVSPRVKT